MPVTSSQISVVICAYSLDRWDWLCDAVASIVPGQFELPRELLVVIDHNEELLERARSTLEGARVLANDEARGLSGARNTGLQAAGGSVVAYLDDDAVADPGWLGALASAYESDAVLAVGGSAAAAWERSRPGWFPEEFEWVVGCSYLGLPSKRAPVRNPIGCNMSVRRQRVLDVGGFRSEVGRIGTRPTGGDETELAIRLSASDPDGVILYEPAARIRHHVPATRATLSYFRARCFSEGVSKAIVARLAGSAAALAVERRYVRRTLPAGILRGIDDAIRGRPAGLARAGAILFGLAVTIAGYVYGKLSRAELAAGRR